MLKKSRWEEETVKRWYEEYEVMIKFKHENIVRLLYVPDELKAKLQGHHLIAMEYCKEGALSQVRVIIE